LPTARYPTIKRHPSTGSADRRRRLGFVVVPGKTRNDEGMSPTWIWLQSILVVLIIISMIIAITKLT